MGRLKGKTGMQSDVPGLQLVVPWENKPLIQTCNWCYCLYRHNITTIDYGFEFVSVCKVNFQFGLTFSCWMFSFYPNGCYINVYLQEKNCLMWVTHISIIRMCLYNANALIIGCKMCCRLNLSLISIFECYFVSKSCCTCLILNPWSKLLHALYE